MRERRDGITKAEAGLSFNMENYSKQQQQQQPRTSCLVFCTREKEKECKFKLVS